MEYKTNFEMPLYQRFGKQDGSGKDKGGRRQGPDGQGPCNGDEKPCDIGTGRGPCGNGIGRGRGPCGSGKGRGGRGQRKNQGLLDLIQEF